MRFAYETYTLPFPPRPQLLTHPHPTQMIFRRGFGKENIKSKSYLAYRLFLHTNITDKETKSYRCRSRDGVDSGRSPGESGHVWSLPDPAASLLQLHEMGVVCLAQCGHDVSVRRAAVALCGQQYRVYAQRYDQRWRRWLRQAMQHVPHGMGIQSRLYIRCD